MLYPCISRTDPALNTSLPLDGVDDPLQCQTAASDIGDNNVNSIYPFFARNIVEWADLFQTRYIQRIVSENKPLCPDIWHTMNSHLLANPYTSYSFTDTLQIVRHYLDDYLTSDKVLFFDEFESLIRGNQSNCGKKAYKDPGHLVNLATSKGKYKSIILTETPCNIFVSVKNLKKNFEFIAYPGNDEV